MSAIWVGWFSNCSGLRERPYSREGVSSSWKLTKEEYHSPRKFLLELATSWRWAGTSSCRRGGHNTPMRRRPACYSTSEGGHRSCRHRQEARGDARPAPGRRTRPDSLCTLDDRLDGRLGTVPLEFRCSSSNSALPARIVEEDRPVAVLTK